MSLSIENRQTNIFTNSTLKKRRDLRLFFGKLLLLVGLTALIATLIYAEYYSTSSIYTWYEPWGRYGTALFMTWLLVPFIISTCATLIGIIILWREYLRED